MTEALTPTQIAVWLGLAVVIAAGLVVIASVIGSLIEAMGEGHEAAADRRAENGKTNTFPGVDIDAVHRRYAASRTKRE